MHSFVHPTRFRACSYVHLSKYQRATKELIVRASLCLFSKSQIPSRQHVGKEFNLYEFWNIWLPKVPCEIKRNPKISAPQCMKSPELPHMALQAITASSAQWPSHYHARNTSLQAILLTPEFGSFRITANDVCKAHTVMSNNCSFRDNCLHRFKSSSDKSTLLHFRTPSSLLVTQVSVRKHLSTTGGEQHDPAAGSPNLKSGNKQTKIEQSGTSSNNGKAKKGVRPTIAHNAIRVNKDGSWSRIKLASNQLGIHPRDMGLLDSVGSAPQRATIAVRNGKILVRMENVHALLSRDYNLLFDARKPRSGWSPSGSTKQPSSVIDTEEGKLTKYKPHSRSTEAFAVAMAAAAQEGLSFAAHRDLPFHLRMLECILEETGTFFLHKYERLKVVVERMLEELTDDVSMAGLHRLLPLKRALTALEHDVKEAHLAMEEVVTDDELLAAVVHGDDTCPKEPDENSPRSALQGLNRNMGTQGEPSKDEATGGGSAQAWKCVETGPVVSNKEEEEGRLVEEEEEEEEQGVLTQAAVDMLLSYQREVQDIGSALEEMRENLESAQEVWELGLATTRNRIIQTNLFIGITTLSLTMCMVPASIFGMNLSSGLEGHPYMFQTVTWICTGASLSTLLGFLFVYKYWPSRRDRRRAEDLAALRDLLHHMDDIDDILHFVASTEDSAWEQFHDLVRCHPSAQFMHKREVDLIFRVFDANRNGVLEVAEISTKLPEKQ